MSDNNDDIDFKEFVKIYSNDSKRIPLLGSVFHNPKSREMWLLMSSTHKEFYLKEMAVIIEKTENPRLPIYEHHISTMVEAGIVLVRIKMHNKHLTKFYRAAPVILLTTPQLYEKATKSQTLKNVFTKVFKFAAIGISFCASWFFLNTTQILTSSTGGQFIQSPSSTTSIIIPFIILISGLIIERIHNHLKNGHSIIIE